MSSERELLTRFGKRFARGSTLYLEGESAEECHWVHQGRVRLTRKVAGVERAFALIKPGEICGEDTFLTPHVRRFSAFAITDVEVISLDRRSFEVLLTNRAQLAVHLFEQLAIRLKQTYEQVENLLLPDMSVRVVNTLLHRTEPQAHLEGEISVAISPLELAAQVTSDSDLVKRVIRDLQSRGYVRLEQETIVVIERAELRRLFDSLLAAHTLRTGF